MSTTQTPAETTAPAASPSITPTVGRIIYFVADAEMGLQQSEAPLAAIIAAVNEDGTINIGAFSQSGHQFAVQNVPIVEMAKGKEVPAHGHFAYWMPYQLTAAAATTAKK